MSKLSSKARRSLPKSDFALLGKRAYPVPDKGHAEAALGRSANKSPAVRAAVRAKVAAKFPGLINRSKVKR